MVQSNHIKNELSLAELEILNSFLMQLLSNSASSKVKMIYRGDNLGNLCHRLGVKYDTSDIDFQTLLERLFMIGEKARHFYDDSIEGRYLSIEGAGREAFDYLFDHLHKAVRNRRKAYVQFFSTNVLFREYFADKKNKRVFIDAAMGHSEYLRMYFRERYQTLLHQLAAPIYKEKSHVVSTSRNHHVAKKFAGGGVDNIDSCIIHAWKPNMNRFRLINNSLPNYKGYPFSHQEETSIIAGILPHYIIAL